MEVTIVGTGNVAYHLVKAFHKSSAVTVKCICGTSKQKARLISQSKSTLCTGDLTSIPASDVLLVCVGDDSIQKVAKSLNKNIHLGKTIIAHTSGTVSREVLSLFKNYGVFYPLQTFSKSRKINFAKIPLCIDSSRKAVAKKLSLLASTITKDIRYLDDTQRSEVHISAVIVNNLTNHLIHLAQSRLEKKNIDGDILLPLIK